MDTLAHANLLSSAQLSQEDGDVWVRCSPAKIESTNYCSYVNIIRESSKEVENWASVCVGTILLTKGLHFTGITLDFPLKK